MRKTVYFDTNVFDHIHKGVDVTKADRLALRSAVGKGRISILLSVLNLEEALCALEQSHTRAIAELRLILELTERGQLVKPPSILLGDDIRCYAQGDCLLETFITLDPVIQSNLQVLVNPNQKDINDLRLIVKETQKQKEDFVVAMREANAKVLPTQRSFFETTKVRHQAGKTIGRDLRKDLPKVLRSGRGYWMHVKPGNQGVTQSAECSNGRRGEPLSRLCGNFRKANS